MGLLGAVSKLCFIWGYLSLCLPSNLRSEKERLAGRGDVPLFRLSSWWLGWSGQVLLGNSNLIVQIYESPGNQQPSSFSVHVLKAFSKSVLSSKRLPLLSLDSHIYTLSESSELDPTAGKEHVRLQASMGLLPSGKDHAPLSAAPWRQLSSVDKLKATSYPTLKIETKTCLHNITEFLKKPKLPLQGLTGPFPVPTTTKWVPAKLSSPVCI